MIQALIVDDEQKSISTLKKLLTDYCPEVEVVGTAENITEAAALIKNLQPQLLFLDVEMPYGNGMELLDQFEVIPFETIFITAYGQYALNAFRYGSIDYLLKPISIEQLREAVERVRKKLADKQLLEGYLLENQQKVNIAAAEQKIQLNGTSEQWLIPCGNIIYCIASGSYTNVHFVNGKKFHSSKSLKHFEKLLPPSIFYRIHHGHLININYLEKIVKGHGGSVLMTDGKELEIAVRRKEEFINALK